MSLRFIIDSYILSNLFQDVFILLKCTWKSTAGAFWCLQHIQSRQDVCSAAHKAGVNCEIITGIGSGCQDRAGGSVHDIDVGEKRGTQETSDEELLWDRWRLLFQKTETEQIQKYMHWYFIVIRIQRSIKGNGSFFYAVGKSMVSIVVLINPCNYVQPVPDDAWQQASSTFRFTNMSISFKRLLFLHRISALNRSVIWWTMDVAQLCKEKRLIGQFEWIAMMLCSHSLEKRFKNAVVILLAPYIRKLARKMICCVADTIWEAFVFAAAVETAKCRCAVSG